MTHLDLPFAWALVVGFALAMYIVLDGFDLGVGILLLSAKREDERDLMVRSIAPVWDGNETWLVMVGVGLLGGFPAAYGILLPAFYLPAFVMLMSLAFRGVSFEFRFQAGEGRGVWDYAICAGSFGAAISQGIVIGGLIQGVQVNGLAFAGGAWDFLSPFSICCGVTLAFGYAFIGACWLYFRSIGELAERARRQAVSLLALFAAGVILAVLWARTLQPMSGSSFVGIWRSAAPWLNGTLFVIAATVSAWILLQGKQRWSFPSAAALFLVTFAGLELALYPYAVPFRLTIWQVASAERSQAALLAAVIVLLPVVLFYSGYSYYVFRGKVTSEDLDEGQSPQAREAAL